jgi:hypothetical protein
MHFSGSEAIGTSQHESPWGRSGGFESLDEADEVFPFLDRSHVKDERLARDAGSPTAGYADSVVDYAEPGRIDVEQLADLVGGGLGDTDDEIRAACSFPGDPGEPPPEVGRGILRGEDEEVVECHDGTAAARSGQALVESVEQVRMPGLPFLE